MELTDRLLSLNSQLACAKLMEKINDKITCEEYLSLQ